MMSPTIICVVLKFKLISNDEPACSILPTKYRWLQCHRVFFQRTLFSKQKRKQRRLMQTSKYPILM
jgi:hypothetical protein